MLGSEAGVLPVDPAKVVRRGRLHPGRLFIVDLERGLLQADGEAELEVAARAALRRLVRGGRDPARRPRRARPRCAPTEPLRTRQLAFGYSQEDLRVLISPAAEAGIEPTGSMGNDLALAALSETRAVAVQLLQAALRAGHQPADRLGARVDRDEPRVADRLRGQHALRGPRARRPARARAPGAHQRRARAGRPRLAPGAARDDPRRDLAAARPASAGLEAALDRIAREASAAITGGANLIVISDRGARPPTGCRSPRCSRSAPCTSTWSREGTRLQTSLVVETGEAREIHHIAALIGYGAAAVNPYLLLESLADLHGRAELPRATSARARRPSGCCRRSARAC